ncbi:MAG TPA: hypothetical protein VE961_18980, partial [Pyrinomonadaceae bacterium]|nr:hypothetical protein [Pyrinomonadaceae bacterium]
MAENLRQFLSEIATDPKRLGAFISDPEAAMDEAGLEDDDKQLVKSADLVQINQRLLAESKGEATPPVVVIVGTEGVRSHFTEAAKGVAASPSTFQTFPTLPQLLVHPNISPYLVAPLILPPQITPHIVAPLIWPPQITPHIVTPLITPQITPHIVAPLILPPQITPHIVAPLILPPQITPHIVAPQIAPQIVTPTLSGHP